MNEKKRLVLDGETVEFQNGETVLEVAERAGCSIPLCAMIRDSSPQVPVVPVWLRSPVHVDWSPPVHTRLNQT